MSGNSFSPRTLQVVRARARGACEGCGKTGVRLEAHHRKFRSRGGDGGAANCLLLCGFGNSSGCHGVAHSASPQTGWAVSRGQSSESTPVLLYRFGFVPVYLTDTGLVLTAGRACWVHSSPVKHCAACVMPGRVLWDADEDRGW